MARHERRSLGTLSSTPGIQDSVLRTIPSAASKTSVSVSIHGQNSQTGARPSNNRLLKQGGDFHSGLSSRTGILLKSLPGSEKIGKMEDGNRSFQSQSFHQGRSVQDGIRRFHQTVSKNRRMGSVYRSIRRLSTRPYTRVVPKISQICDRGESLPMSCPPVRTFSRSLRLHTYHEDSSGVLSQERSEIPCVSRRFLMPCCHCKCMSLTSTADKDNHGKSRFLNKYKEIRDDSSPTVHVSGRGIRFEKRPGISSRSSSGNLSRSTTIFDRPNYSHSQKTPSSTRTYGVVLTHPSGGESSETRTAAPFEPIVGLPTLGSTIVSGEVVPSHDTTVEGSGFLTTEISASSAPSDAVVIHRCVRDRMGSPPRNASRIREVGAGNDRPTHQFPRNGSCKQSSICFQQSNAKPSNPLAHGQYDRSRIYQQRGGGSLTGPMPIISIDTSEGLGITGSLDCPPHTRGIECSGRFSEQTGKNSTHRVDYTSGNTEQYLRDMGQASNRSVCYTSESQTSPVRLASTRPSSMECRRARVRLDGTGRIRLSPTNSPVSGTRENPIRVLLGDSSRPELAGTALVSSTPITTDRSTGKAVTETGSANATPVQTNPSEAGSVQATRLETIQCSLKNRGFSEQASLQLSSVRRLSTEKIYQSHWRSWVDWTNSRQVDPCNPPVNQLTEFLLYLYKEKNLSQGTVKSYRSAICTTIRQSGGPDLASDPILRELVNSLKIIGPKPIPRVPDWDVFIVLEALKSNPFEPPEKCTLENWSYKTAFLMALATAKRRSELHALDYNSIRWAEDSVTLSTLPDFVAKNQRPGETFPIIKVPSLSKTLTKSDTHRRVCPVRALRWYLHKSKDLRTNQRRVFISFSKVGKEIAQATLSRWIVKAISISLKENGNLPCNRATPRAHEVRAVATSLALLRSVSMENILRAAFWRNESTFSRFYLRDMTRSVDGRARLPVVAAQQILY